MHTFAVPAEEQFEGAEKHALRRDQRLIYVGEGAIVLRNLIEQRDIVQCPRGVWLKVPEAPITAYPDLPGIVDCERPDDLHGSIDLSPGDSVVLQHVPSGHAEVHNSTMILKDCPDLPECVELVMRMRFEDRHPDAVIRWIGRC